MAYGDITAELDSFEHTDYSRGPALLKVGSDILLYAYVLSGYVTVATRQVDDLGNTGAIIDWLTIDSSNLNSGTWSSIVHVTGDVYAITYDQIYHSSGRMYTRVKTFNVDSSGNITTNTGYLLLFQQTLAEGTSSQSQMALRGESGGNYIVIIFWAKENYRGYGTPYITTVSIPSDGSTITLVETLDIEPTAHMVYSWTELQHVYENIYLTVRTQEYSGQSIKSRCVDIPSNGVGLSCPYATTSMGGNNGLGVARLEPTGNIWAWFQALYFWTRNVANDGLIGAVIDTIPPNLETWSLCAGAVALPKNPLNNRVIILRHYHTNPYRRFQTMDFNTDGTAGTYYLDLVSISVPQAIYSDPPLIFKTGLTGDLNLIVVREHNSGAGNKTHIATVYVESPPINPIVTSASPSAGKPGETLSVVIGGTYFTGATSVDFGADITVNTFTVDSDIQITASITISGTATLGLRDVSVTTGYGTGTLSNGFTIYAVAPTVTSVTPNEGNQGDSGLSIIITGSSFAGATSVSFGAGITVNLFTVDSDTQITADITIDADANIGPRDVEVVSAYGTGALAGGFSVMPVGTSVTLYSSGTKGLNILYVDEDGVNTLHVALENLSPTAKDAGEDGEVILEITYNLEI